MDDRYGRGAPEPLYAAIKKYVVDGIARGDLRPGDRVESEAELIKKFGVSRMTAHRALRELQNSGILTRLPGVGTFVADPSAKGHIIEIRNIADEIRSRGHQHGSYVVKNVAEKASKKTGSMLGVEPGTQLFHSVIVHSEAGIPIQLEERFVLAEIAPGYDKVDFTSITPNEFLTRAAPLERVDHVVRAVMPDRDVAALLDIETVEPCLLLIRQTWSRSRLVSYARLTHPGSRFEFEDSFTV
ncbi:histidine utilization repressor [Sphingomonas xanthus]|uniref:histidine utilization repressor n=1 Tax=Sphingomonas xanthus TaxID=2594473 RepID=UPI001FE6AEE1|nr:histidine utilization repressor [Sphingomonas xanthus]